MSLSVGIIDYQAGNIRSLCNAFECLGVGVSMISKEEDIRGTTHLVLPGVGAFGHCAKNLRESGLLDILFQWVFHDKRPLLGICVGMQLFSDSSEEHGVHPGLGWVGGSVRRLQPNSTNFRIPHVGWNTVHFQSAFGSFRIGDKADFYFDHSYAYFATPDGMELGTCCHGVEFTAVVRKENLLAAQFHPEKSQDAGKKFLTSFLSI